MRKGKILKEQHNLVNRDKLREDKELKATGIVRRIDELGRVVIPKEIRRTLRIREGDPLLTTRIETDGFLMAMLELADRLCVG